MSVSHRAATIRILVALVLGLAAGMAIAAFGNAALSAAASVFEPLGTLWVNAIRMTVVPLVPSLLIVGVASSGDVRRIGRLGARAVPLFVVLLTAGALLAVVIAPPLMAWLTITPAVAASLRAAAAPASLDAARQMPTVAQWVVDLVPTNPLRAAVEGAMLPLIVFSLLFGLAATRIAPASRDQVVRLFRAIADALMVIVGWVLVVAPLGVFALMLGLGMRMGAGAAGAIAYYIAVLSGTLLLFTILLYPVAVLGGRISLRRFATAMAPVQAVAVSTRSSFAALPAMIAAARDRLGFPPDVTGFVLPLAVSVFRVNVPIAWIVGVLFLGRLYGVPVNAAHLAGMLVAGVAMSFAVPGIPSGGPYLLAAMLGGTGLPPEGVGILIAVDTIPDMFKTILSVTGHVTCATLLARYAARRDADA